MGNRNEKKERRNDGTDKQERKERRNYGTDKQERKERHNYVTDKQERKERRNDGTDKQERKERRNYVTDKQERKERRNYVTDKQERKERRNYVTDEKERKEQRSLAARGDDRFRCEDEKAHERKIEKIRNSEKKTCGKPLRIPGQFCPVEKKCGGCQFLHLTNEQQLVLKQKKAEELLGKYCKVYSVTGMEQPLRYRNKVHAVFTHKKDGTIISGTYAEGTHDVVPVNECLLENETADAIIRTIRGLLKSFKIKTYNEDTGYGLFRHALIRTAHQTGQVMVVLVLGSPILPSKNNFVKALRQAHPEITTIVLNVNDKKTSMVLGEKETVLYGKGYIEDILCGCRFRISAKSFYQINSIQTEKLYAKAMELAQLTEKDRVIDAYCGIGTIGMVAAKQAGEVIGVELNPDAVKDAIRNAKANEMKNIRFYQNDAGQFMVGMAQEGAKADVVFMDPPRAGSDEAFLSSVLQLAPKRIVYISCNPETQARDLEYLTKKGYRAEGVWPFDLFPFTNHVETVCLLSSQKSDMR